MRDIERYRAGGYCWVVVGSTQKGRGLKAGLRVVAALLRGARRGERGDGHVLALRATGADPVEFSYDFSFNYAPRAFERPGPVVEIHRLRTAG